MTSSELSLSTRCAHWGWGNHRYFGYGVFDELAGRETMTGLIALSVLGRKLPQSHCDVLDDIVCISTLADPRIWPLKITRLVASFGSVMPAIAAGLLNLEGAIVSPWVTSEAAETLERLRQRLGKHDQDHDAVRCAIEELFEEGSIVTGFGIPCRVADERLAALKSCMNRRNRDTLPYFSLLTTITSVELPSRRFVPNIGLGIAAAMLDMEIERSRIGALTTALFQHMFFANALEGASDASEVLRELPCTSIAYSGPPRRVSPRAQVHRSMLRPAASGTADITDQNTLSRDWLRQPKSR